MRWLYLLILVLYTRGPLLAWSLPSTHAGGHTTTDTVAAYQPRDTLKHQQSAPTTTVYDSRTPNIQQPTFSYGTDMQQEPISRPGQHDATEGDGDFSKKIIGSSVVTSVSVILNGDEAQYTDALGHKVPKPQPSFKVASPIDLLNPDRYEFYTFDDNGDLVKRLMTMQEIQSIVANGNGEGPTIIHTAPMDEREPEKNVQDIVYSVQNVLNKQVENVKNITDGEVLPVLDTPDVSSSWSMILPAIFGNTGGDIYPQHKPQQIVMTPDSELLESATKVTTTIQTSKKPKPHKRKPGQKRKTSTTTTTEITPQVVQEELEPHESVYTGIQQYQNIASNVHDFDSFSQMHVEPIYHKLPESTTRHSYIDIQEVIQNTSTNKENDRPVATENTTKKTGLTNKRTSPNRKNVTKRPRPSQNTQKLQKKPTQSQSSNDVTSSKIKPAKKQNPTTPTTIPEGSTANPEGTITSSTTAVPTTIKKNKKRPTQRPTIVSDSITQTQPQTTKRKTSTPQKTKPTAQQNKRKNKPTVDSASLATHPQATVLKSPHKHRPSANKPPTSVTTPLPTSVASPSLVSSTEGSLIVESYPGLAPALKAQLGTKVSTTQEPFTKNQFSESTTTAYVSPGYPIPSYGLNEQDDRFSVVEDNTMVKLGDVAMPSLSLIQQQYQSLQDEALPNQSQTEDDLKLSFGQIVQSLKQETNTKEVIGTSTNSLKPLGYNSAESADKLEEILNKRKKPFGTSNVNSSTITEMFVSEPYINPSNISDSAVVSIKTPIKNFETVENVQEDDKIELPVQTFETAESVYKPHETDLPTTTLIEDTTTEYVQELATNAVDKLEIETFNSNLDDSLLTPVTETEIEENDKSETNNPSEGFTTTNSPELELDETADIFAIKEDDSDTTMNSVERLPVTLAQLVETLLENESQGDTTITPPEFADLNSQLNMSVVEPTSPILMSDFQTHAATFASHLIDKPKYETHSTSEAVSNETKNQIDLIMSDVMQQINHQNMDDSHRLTNVAQFNNSFLYKSPSEMNSLNSSTEQEINRILTNLLHELPKDIETQMYADIATTQFPYTLEEEQATTTSSNFEDATINKDDFPYEHINEESTTISLETNHESSTETEKNNAQSIVNTNYNNAELAKHTKNSDKIQVDEDSNKNFSEIVSTMQNKLNKFAENAELLSTTENIKHINATKAVTASDEYNVEERTTINYSTEQLLQATETTENNASMENNDKTDKVNVPLEDSGIAKMEVNINRVTSENTRDQGGANDITNPINSATQSTENVQILSAINNNLQETMSSNEIGTESPIGTTSLFAEANEQEDYKEQSTEADAEVEPTTIEFNEQNDYIDTSTISSDEKEEDTTSLAEDPYIKLGETIISPQNVLNEKNTVKTNISNSVDKPLKQDAGPVLNMFNADKPEIPIEIIKPTSSPLLLEDNPNKTVADKPLTNSIHNKLPVNLNVTYNENDDEEDEDDQSTKPALNTTSKDTSITPLSSVTTSTLKPTTIKRYNTLKPVSYYKQPLFAALNQPEYPKPVTYITSQQRPMQRPAALSNLKASSMQATRPPVKLEPSPTHSKGLEASTLSLDPNILNFIRLCNELAFSYWKSITAEKISSARSLVISPFALTSMLSMVFLGARGSTSGEMNEVLKLDDMITFNPHLIFKNITDSVETATDSDIATTAFVREIFSDRVNGKLLPFFKEKTQQFYAGHVEEVNFNVVNDVIRRRTNLLVKRHTMGKVLEYLRTNSVWVNGPLATISANLFQTDCTRGSTIDRDGELFFQVHPTVRQRRLVPIPAVLYKTGFTAGYDPKLDATIVAFGRIQNTVSTIYVMPGHQSSTTPVDNLDRLENQLIEQAFTDNAWSNLLTSLMDRPGLEVQLPRFSHRSFVNASLGLQKMGLKGLFMSDFADLRGLTGSSGHDVFLSDMIQINTFSTCGEERIADQHHVEMYPAPPLRKRNKDVDANDDDTLDSSEAIIDFGSLVHESALARSFYDDLLDPKYLELPLPLRPRQARVPDAPPRLRFDKPFMYFVRHNPTGIILFMGRFNPRLLP